MNHIDAGMPCNVNQITGDLERSPQLVKRRIDKNHRIGKVLSSFLDFAGAR